MLRAAGIEADPVLVDTYGKTTNVPTLPAPTAFNHVICRIKLAPDTSQPERKEFFFIDPTITLQGGSIENRYCPDYGKGLVLNQGERALTDIKLRIKGKIHIKNDLTVFERTSNQQSELSVYSDYRGDEADNLRSQFQNARLSDTERGYLQFYKSLFPESDVEAIDSLQIFDDRDSQNLISTYERYSLDNLWFFADTHKAYVIRVGAQTFSQRLPAVPNRSRHSPFSLLYPLHIVEEVNVFLPKGNWQLENEEYVLERDSYRLSYKASFEVEKKFWRLLYEYETFQDHVSADDVNQLRLDVAKIRENLNYELTEPSGLPQKKLNVPVFLLLLVSMLVGSYYAKKYYRYSPHEPTGRKPENFQFWLIILGITVVLNPVSQLYQSIASPGDYLFTPISQWSFSGTGTWGFVVSMFSMVAHALLFALAYLYFRKRTTFPVSCVVYFWAAFGIRLFTLFCLLLIHGKSLLENSNESFLLGEFIRTVAWTYYLNKSTHVKTVFVNGYHDKITPEIATSAADEEGLTHLPAES